MAEKDFQSIDSPQRQPGLEYEMEPEPDYLPRFAGSERLAGKVALITGGDSGIGRATPILYARERAKMAIVYLDEDRDAEKTKELIEDEGGEGLLIRGDIGDKSFCQYAVRKTVEKFGQLDILVNNAGEQHAQDDPEDIEEAQIEWTFRTNIFGMMFMTQAALPHLKKGARIICLTSITAYKGHLGLRVRGS